MKRLRELLRLVLLSKWLPVFVFGLALVLCLPALSAGLMLDDIPMLNPLGGAGTYVQGVRLMDGQRAQPGRTPIGAYAEGRY